jgi:hypothetical protein
MTGLCFRLVLDHNLSQLNLISRTQKVWLESLEAHFAMTKEIFSHFFYSIVRTWSSKESCLSLVANHTLANLVKLG